MKHSSHLSNFQTKWLSAPGLSETILKSCQTAVNVTTPLHSLKCKNYAGAKKALGSLMVDSLAQFAVVTCLYSVFAKGVNLLAIKCSLLLQYLCLFVGLHRRGASLL